MEKVLKVILSPNFIASAIIIAVAICIVVIGGKIYKNYLKKTSKDIHANGKKATLMSVIVNIVRYLFIVIVFLVILQVNGVNVGSLFAGLGLASAVFGLAMQDFLKDVVMGINIISEDFFSVGDVVRYNSLEGEIVSFGIRTTKLKSYADGSVYTISNRNISEAAKIAPQFDIDLPLSYDEDVRKIHSVLRNTCEKIKEINGITDCVYKGTERFDDSAIIYKIRVFCPPHNKYDLRREAISLIQNALNENNIEIPYNQLDVHTVVSTNT